MARAWPAEAYDRHGLPAAARSRLPEQGRDVGPVHDARPRVHAPGHASQLRHRRGPDRRRRARHPDRGHGRAHVPAGLARGPRPRVRRTSGCARSSRVRSSTTRRRRRRTTPTAPRSTSGMMEPRLRLDGRRGRDRLPAWVRPTCARRSSWATSRRSGSAPAAPARRRSGPSGPGPPAAAARRTSMSSRRPARPCSRCSDRPRAQVADGAGSAVTDPAHSFSGGEKLKMIGVRWHTGDRRGHARAGRGPARHYAGRRSSAPTTSRPTSRPRRSPPAPCC